MQIFPTCLTLSIDILISIPTLNTWCISGDLSTIKLSQKLRRSFWLNQINWQDSLTNSLTLWVRAIAAVYMIYFLTSWSNADQLMSSCPRDALQTSLERAPPTSKYFNNVGWLLLYYGSSDCLTWSTSELVFLYSEQWQVARAFFSSDNSRGFVYM